MKKTIQLPANQLSAASYNVINAVIDQIAELNATIERLSFEKSRAEALARLAESKVPYPLEPHEPMVNNAWHDIEKDWRWRYAVRHGVLVQEYQRVKPELGEIVELPYEFLTRLCALEGDALDHIVFIIGMRNHPD